MHAYVARATEIGRVLKNSVDKSCSVDIFFFLFFFSLSDYSNVITYKNCDDMNKHICLSLTIFFFN